MMRRPVAIAVGLLVVATLIVPRVLGPMRLEPTNDEMHHHLRSWNHRYGTDDIYPYFAQRLESMRGRLSPRLIDLAVRFYRSGPLAQRAIIVAVDPQPPIYPVTAEVIEAASDSSVLALRSLSVIGGVAFVAISFYLGRALGGPSLGVLTAAMMTAGQLSILSAGVGRPYALVQASVAAAMLAYVMYARDRVGWATMLGVALIAQGMQWVAWCVVGPLVVAAAVHEMQRGVRWSLLLKRSWWYVAASLLLLVYAAAQFQNPTITNQAVSPGLRAMARDYASASFVPFVGGVSTAGCIAVSAALVAAAILSWPLRRSVEANIVVPLLIAAACGLLAMIAAGSAVRLTLTYTLPAACLAALCVRDLLGPRYTATFAAAILLASGVESVLVWRNLDRYGWGDGPYSPIAAAVRTERHPGEPWSAFPYYRANCLYPHGPLDEPTWGYSPAEFASIAAASPTGSVLLFIESDKVTDLEKAGRLRMIRPFSQSLLLVRFSAGPAPAVP